MGAVGTGTSQVPGKVSDPGSCPRDVPTEHTRWVHFVQGCSKPRPGLTPGKPGGSRGATGHSSAPFPRCRAGLKSSREGW